MGGFLRANQKWRYCGGDGSGAPQVSDRKWQWGKESPQKVMTYHKKM